MFYFNIHAQLSSLRIKKIKSDSLMVLDSLKVSPSHLNVFCNNLELTPNQWIFNENTNQIQIKSNCSTDLLVYYRVFDWEFPKIYVKYDTSLLYNVVKGDREKFLITSTDVYQDIFGTSSLKKNGNISRGISVGNNQDLSINSSLNLELTGDLGDNIKILASLSDQNLPIQPQGNTNKLQEFDQVFIQLYNDNAKVIAGDFWLKRPKGYFLNYNKRAQGLSSEFSSNKKDKKIFTQSSGALSKGKFQRQIINGVEGNQGPYRLIGNENEPFIVVLSGTEKVFIDGRQLERGQEYDYVIDYNTSEITFTARNFITKDIRIVVEFQYSDLNYARSLFQHSTVFETKKTSTWFNLYSEQDAKNQSIQSDLSDEDKLRISKIGDSLSLARISSIDSIVFVENQNLYRMTDSLGIDSVLVFSIDPNQAYYRVSFSFVGANKGDYRLKNSTAFGKVYEWLAPVNGIPQGDYIPARLVITPKQKQMLVLGNEFRLGNKFKIETETALSKEDLNTFSSLNTEDDVGISNRTKIQHECDLPSKDSIKNWKQKSSVELEYLSTNFKTIEQYRAVEFDRDWNIRNRGLTGQQLFIGVSNQIAHRKNGSFTTEASQFKVGNNFTGNKLGFKINWKYKGFFADINQRTLLANGSQQSFFIRHKIHLSQKINKIKLGYKDDFERNLISENSVLNSNSYLFYDKEFYIQNSDSAIINSKIFYRERLDQRIDSVQLQDAAKAKTFGADFLLNQKAGQKVNLILNYRNLDVLDSNLLNIKEENTFLGRIDIDQKLLKNVITLNTFYEVGSGLELKKDFLYVQVNDGQGVYTWIDYNGDGVKDLNEFEIAQYIDQASYIRVFTPSNEYVSVYSNEFNQSVFIRPEKVFANKKGFLKGLSYFSNQARWRLYRKTSSLETSRLLNPFEQIADSAIISSSNVFRNSLFFNRTGSVFSADYNIQESNAKTLLTTGFDERVLSSHQVNFRINIYRKWTIEGSYENGRKKAEADYTVGRNFDINYFLVKPSLIFQPNTSLRLAVFQRYQEKDNINGEQALVNEVGFNGKYNRLNKGSFQTQFSLIDIRYSSDEVNALSYEMLESLKVGQNYTWNIGYQHNVSKNLQISIQYNGRKSKDVKMIHSGSMEVRAFF